MQIKKDTLIKIAVALGCSLVVVAMIIFKVFEIFNINLVREESSHLFKHGLVQVKADGKYGYADKSGRIVIPFAFDDAYSFEQGLAAAETDGNWGYIDKNGRTVIEPQFDSVMGFGGSGLEMCIRDRRKR